ncbi:hypothetical protein ABT297_37865 [Dactylosporangium sp. NPDC000555]|uniref:hypothetical protein n=1 Tax=Dactylosporangium sp. NPDC000555 TaxID=3154260 RepID=UPI00332BEBF6
MTTTTQTETPNPPQTRTATQRRGTTRKATEPSRSKAKTTASARSAPKPDQQAAQKKAQPVRAANTPETESELVTWQDVPMPHLKVPIVHMHRPDVRATLANVPQPRHLLYYGGVGALAALGVLEWPVALAAAAGVWVATREHRTPATAG